MRGQDREIEMPNTLVYNHSSSSNLSSPTIGQRNNQQPSQTHTLIFSDPTQTSLNNNHLYSPSPLPSLQPQPQPQPQPQQPHKHIIRDPVPDPPTSFSAPTTCITSTITTPNSSDPTTPLIRYKECLKNHAASMGGHVTDGCGEFMPSGEKNTPQYFICAACQCHRNFHRKEAADQGLNNNRRIQIQYSPSNLLLPTPPNYSVHPHHRRLSGGPAESTSEDLNMFHHNDGGQFSTQQPQQLSKKRFRTKFTQQQKDSMMEFAEKVGWKIQKQDEKELQEFCSQVGLNRQVFKVWMHNSKQAMKKKQM